MLRHEFRTTPTFTLKYAATDKPHTRMTELVIDPARSRHDRRRHLQPQPHRPPRRRHAPPLRARQSRACGWSSRKPTAPLSPAPGLRSRTGPSASTTATKTIRPLAFRGVASAHEQLDRTAEGLYPYLGYVVRAGSLHHLPSRRHGALRWPGREAAPLRHRRGPAAHQRNLAPNAASPATCGAGKPPGSPGASAPASSSPATTTCSNSIPKARPNSSPTAKRWASPITSCATAKGSACMYLGIDIGGTRLKAGLVDEDGRILRSAHTPPRPPRARRWNPRCRR